MIKLTGKEIIETIERSRRDLYQSEECWTDIETMGLYDYYPELGKIELVQGDAERPWDFYDVKFVWHFVDHEVYIEGTLGSGSYGSGYRLDVWSLKEVFPKKKEITIYE
jgi:hypothetical protein